MTVLEEDPVSILHGCRNHLLSHWTLSLPQRDGMDPVCGVRVCGEEGCGVRVCGEEGCGECVERRDVGSVGMMKMCALGSFLSLSFLSVSLLPAFLTSPAITTLPWLLPLSPPNPIPPPPPHPSPPKSCLPLSCPHLSMYPFSLANRRKLLMGSEPGDRMKTRGVVFEVSSYSVESFTGGLSTN